MSVIGSDIRGGRRHMEMCLEVQVEDGMMRNDVGHHHHSTGRRQPSV